jgi:hypothetical protein
MKTFLLIGDFNLALIIPLVINVPKENKAEIRPISVLLNRKSYLAIKGIVVIIILFDALITKVIGTMIRIASKKDRFLLFISIGNIVTYLNFS